MTKEQFMNKVTEKVRQQCILPDIDISCGTFIKNNDTPKHGIIMKKRNEFISPTIYVDGLYQDFLRKKKTIPEVADRVMEVLEKINVHAEQYKDFSVEFDDCKDEIIYRLISYERNEVYLESIPHLPFLNLAIVFSIICRITENGLETITVTNELMEKWQTDTKELVCLAEKNTPRLLPFTADSLTSVLTQYIGFSDSDTAGIVEDPQIPPPMLLLSNASGVNGAAVMLYPDAIHQLAMQYNSNLYILPSSIHEIIVVPDKKAGTKMELSEIVKDINEKHVSREEVLSDTAYYYDRKEKKFSF